MSEELHATPRTERLTFEQAGAEPEQKNGHTEFDLRAATEVVGDLSRETGGACFYSPRRSINGLAARSYEPVYLPGHP